MKILEHAKRPRLFGRMSDPDLGCEAVNPLCGDRIRVELRLSGGDTVDDIRFSGEMCAIAKASASILFSSLEGMTAAAISDVSDERVLTALGGPIASHRRPCALLPLRALKGAILPGKEPTDLNVTSLDAYHAQQGNGPKLRCGFPARLRRPDCPL